jgi:large subunit ribosomal protein L15
MQIHDIQKNTSDKKKKTVGRGGKRGKTAGRGTKGQNSRAGRKKRPEIRDIIKKLPKQRGRGKNSNKSVWLQATIANLDDIAALYKAGDVVTPQNLVANGLLRAKKGITPAVKILAKGTIDKKLTFKGFKISAAAKALIEGAGGEVK